MRPGYRHGHRVRMRESILCYSIPSSWVFVVGCWGLRNVWLQGTGSYSGEEMVYSVQWQWVISPVICTWPYRLEIGVGRCGAWYWYGTGGAWAHWTAGQKRDLFTKGFLSEGGSVFYYIIQRWARGNFLASRKRNRVSGTKKNCNFF